MKDRSDGLACRHLKPAEIGFSSAISSWPGRLSFLIVAAYIARSSVLVSIIPSGDRLFMLGGYAAVLATVALIILSRASIFPPGLLFLIACVPGVLLAQKGDADRALINFAGLTLLMIAVGPVLRGDGPRLIRGAAWETSMWLVIFIGVGSFLWYVLRLPNLGFGGFSGVMTHSMLLGPFAALGAIICIARATNFASWRWFISGILCLLPSVAAGSRLALVSFGVALLAVVFLFRRKVRYFVPILVMIGGAVVLVAIFFPDEGFGDRLTERLQEKGLNNSREELWEARWAEFRNNPVVGVGVSITYGAGRKEDDFGRVTVEPGSSYLGLLSMTGVLGGGAFVILFGSSLFSHLRRLHLVSEKRTAELVAVGSFMVVHAGGEGYLLAVGSPLALIFWLWLGCLLDSSPHGFPRPRRLLRDHAGKKRVKKHSVDADLQA